MESFHQLWSWQIKVTDCIGNHFLADGVCNSESCDFFGRKFDWYDIEKSVFQEHSDFDTFHSMQCLCAMLS